MDAYQTVFARLPGSAEMASAARPFTASLVAGLVSSGVLVAPVTLHTGLSSQEAGEAPQPERFAVSGETADLVNLVRSRGSRVVAVGTTATRAIESAADPDGRVHPAAGWTEVVISPDRPARVVDGLVTGWHDPDASHLLLVESVAGPTWPSGPTTRRSPTATRGTSSATRASSCPAADGGPTHGDTAVGGCRTCT